MTAVDDRPLDEVEDLPTGTTLEGFIDLGAVEIPDTGVPLPHNLTSPPPLHDVGIHVGDDGIAVLTDAHGNGLDLTGMPLHDPLEEQLTRARADLAVELAQRAMINIMSPEEVRRQQRFGLQGEIYCYCSPRRAMMFQSYPEPQAVATSDGLELPAWAAWSGIALAVLAGLYGLAVIFSAVL